MKNIILIALLLLAMTGFAKDYDISGTKEGGKRTTLNGNRYIGYDYVHVDVNHTTGKITYICRGEGVNACRAQVDGHWMRFVTSNGNTFDYDNYMTTINSLMDTMDEKSLEGIIEGRHTQQVSAVSNEGNRCTLVFGIVWQLDGEGNGTFNIKIDELRSFNF